MLECCREKRGVDGGTERKSKELRKQRPFFDSNASPRPDSQVDAGNRDPVISAKTVSDEGDLRRDGDPLLKELIPS